MTNLKPLAFTEDIAAWIDALPGKPKSGIDYFVSQARSAADEFGALGMTNVTLEPGDGTSYKMWIADISRHARRAGDYNFSHLDGMMLVSLPYNGRGGASYVFSQQGYHVPGYVGEKLGVAPHEATVLAAFLTLFSVAVAVTR